MYMRPFDDTVHMSGWYDVHHAEGPDTWNDGLYKSPTDFYLHVDNPKEIVFWGEDGAISTPSRIGSITRALDALPRPGWDGAVYQQWFRTFDEFLTRKRLRAAFPDVDALTTAMAAISLEHQGRKIENVRIGDQGDGYVVNGWESQITENHSGIVDAFRHPKADPALMRRYAEPLYVAVKLRSQVVAGRRRGRRGSVTSSTNATARRPRPRGGIAATRRGSEVAKATFPVTAIGGDTIRPAAGRRRAPGHRRTLRASPASRRG